MYQGYISRITERVSGIHARECIRDTYQGLQKVYRGYMLEITESVSGIHVWDYRECIRDIYQGLLRVVSGIHIKDYRECIRDTYLRIQTELWYSWEPWVPDCHILGLILTMVFLRNLEFKIDFNMDWYGSEMMNITRL